MILSKTTITVFVLGLVVGFFLSVGGLARAEVIDYYRTPADPVVDYNVNLELVFEYNDTDIPGSSNGRVIEYFKDGNPLTCTYQSYNNVPNDFIVENIGFGQGQKFSSCSGSSRVSRIFPIDLDNQST